MPTGIYNHKKATIEARINMSLSKKGHPPTFIAKGEKHPMWGKHHTEESRKKISESNKGRSVWNKGLVGVKPASEQLRKKRSEYMKKRVALGIHNFWKGGVSEKNRTERSNIMGTFKYKFWRDSVFKRDGYSCLVCGNKGYLQADHIKSWFEYPKLRFDIDNGRTLCKLCHKFTPTYGKSSIKPSLKRLLVWEKRIKDEKGKFERI